MKNLKIIMILTLLFLVACGGNSNVVSVDDLPAPESSGGSSASGGCTAQVYRESAEPLMQELSDITDQIDLQDADSRREGRDNITAVVTKISSLECRGEFPLKQETLLFAAMNFRDAITAMDTGDATRAAEKLDLATLNAERFNDWSVDMD